jgi:AraC-like DNA-binding protein
MEIILNLAAPFRRHWPEGTVEQQPLMLLVGQMRRHVVIEPTGRVRLFGIRFWPGGAYPFLGFPQDRIADQILDLESVWGKAARELASRVEDAKDGEEAVRLAEKFLLGRLDSFRDNRDLSTSAIALILTTGGRVPVETVAARMGICRRHLDRLFNIKVGLPPKLLCRIVRFQEVFRLLSGQTTEGSWARLALECGYFDQPHFIKEFKSFAGVEPTRYFAEPSEMSVYFTQSDEMSRSYNTSIPSLD